MKNISILFITLSILVGSVMPATVAAQNTPADETESITLSPVSRKYQLDAGQTIQEKITIVNDGKTDYDFLVYSRPYSISQTDTGEFSYDNPNFTATPANADAYSWIRFAQTKYTIKAGATVEVPYAISVPARAAPGGHYGVIFAETQPNPNKSQAGNAVVRKKRVGSIVYATVKGEYITKGQVESTRIPFWQLQPPLSVESTVKNTGNSDITNDTIYTVKDVFGNKKFEQAKQYTILPETTRKMTFEWNEALWFGLYDVALSQTVLGKTSVQSGYVLILPRYIPVMFVAIILIGGGYAWFRRKKNK